MSRRPALAALAAAASLVVAAPAVASSGSYVVRSGDSLWLIAQKEGTTPQRLARLNRLSLASPLPVGLRLRLRATAPATRYVVRPGDSLTAVAQRFRTTVTDLARTNGLSVDGPLLVGARLRVPRPVVVSRVLQRYVIEAGDSLSGIAAHFGTTATALARENHLTLSSTILAGRTLLVPAASGRPTFAEASGAPVAASAPTATSSTLGRLIAAGGMPGVTTAAIVVDLASRQIVYEHDADLALAPASLEKLPLSLATYASLGPSFRIETSVLAAGARSGGVLTGDLILKGEGDPTLSSTDLAVLAAQVRAAGIVQVRGRILGDASYFDARRDVTGWKPEFEGVESPPLSALIVDDAIIDGRLSWDPAAAAAELFRRALVTAGVQVTGASGEGTAPAGASSVTQILSPTIGELVTGMTKASDNFVAEMLLKQLGAHVLGHGTSEAGAEVVRSDLARDGLPPLTVVDGSGLSRLDRITARSLVALLLRLHQTPELVDGLPLAGVDGTLAHRLVGTSLAGHVHAKSGTTDGSSGLAGFIDDRYAFVVVSNGTYVPQTSAHALQDAFVLALGQG